MTKNWNLWTWDPKINASVLTVFGDIILVETVFKNRYTAYEDKKIYGLSEDISGMISALIFSFIYDSWGITFALYGFAANMFIAGAVAYVFKKMSVER